MPLRFKLLLIALVAAVFPLAGWRFVVQMETTLRISQERALMAAARTAASALPAADPQLRQDLLAPASLRTRPMALDVIPDGYRDDWGAWHTQPEALAVRGAPLAARVYAGRGPASINLWLSVDDDSVVEAGSDSALAERADQVLIAVRDRFGERRWRLARNRLGVVAALPLVGADGRQPGFTLPAAWLERSGGYDVELRIPLSDPALDVAIEVKDFPVAGADLPRAVASTEWHDNRFRALSGLWRESALIRSLIPEHTRLRVLDHEGYVLARGGSLRPGSEQTDDADLGLLRWLRALVYRHLLAPPMGDAGGYDYDRLRITTDSTDAALTGTPGVSWRPAASQASVVLAAAVPILHGSDPVGVVLLEQTSDALLLWTNRALGTLLLGGLLTMLVAASILFGYVGYLSWRIRKLRNAAENALSPEGRVIGSFPRSPAADEIGDLSRSFGRLLDQVSAYTDYLRTLGSKLSHELATPLAVVKSSLENLEQEKLPESARIYAERARSGAERLGALLRNLSQAARIESAIAGAEAEDFDLRDFLRGAAAAYRDLAADRQFELVLPDFAVPFHGAPELLHQALDKLVDNALGFTPPGGWIRLELIPGAGQLELVLANSGPPLPEKMQDRLFDSLVSVRDGRATVSPHLGLGLYIVRLVAELHRGEAIAENLADGAGVAFRMRLQGMVRRSVAT